ncbi:LysM peptidoglycan-binding domain-containing protein [Flavobacterium hibernum]|uniref:LysM domain-containing protein n=1 Tax=Flavobacterium hibernum TaxID=37752 RepID=A0A0D0EXC2_9FLAO|nr:LysM peptidoglycan-binding domain-containing protein [Flavobacterium hibernum]KIO51846.1 hypothetical protein IW18_16490 [Flavobacterium hibernum]OXA84278.1 hypothetical protein B0A73_20590 [Flavobacterium hibernum]STO18978.1 Uncharacterised protein [Flavobacterium hibernum]
MRSFKKYKVQRGDTIESIAEKIGIPAVEVRTFHNLYCDDRDLVEFRLPIRRVEYILLPDLEEYVAAKTAQKDAIKKVFNNPENNLRLLVSENLKLDYGTIIQYKENNRVKDKIHFTSQIEFLKRDGNFSIVKFQINQVYINNKEPELVIEKLADRISKALYPVLLRLNDKGEIDNIINIDAIQRRWETIKPAILEYFRGNEVDKLIASFEKTIMSASLLKRSFDDHPFYQIYFAPIYQKYTSDLSFSQTDSTLKTIQIIDEFQTSTSKICLRRKGLEQLFLNDSEDLEKDLNKSEFEIGKLEEENSSNIDFLYKLHHDNNTIFSITGFINSRKNSDVVSTIEFETYERAKRKPKQEIVNPISRKIDWSAEVINEREIKEKGFWDTFWGT